MENRSIFALLIGVGNYAKMNIVNLPTYQMDLSLLGTSLMLGLKVPKDNLRFMAGEDNNGFVTTQNLAKGIAGFKSLLGSEDTFIFYFSGHGRDKNVIFSNGQVELQSIIDFVDKLPAKNKLVILDCCYSGNFKTAGARIMHFDESMEAFAGRGVAVIASSAADEVSRLGPNGNHSMFTGALSSAIMLNKKVRKGQTSLVDIYDEMMHLVKAWNKQNPGKEQQPIFRASMGGTIFFRVEDYHPYEQQKICFETERYSVEKVEPLSTSTVKRLSAFIILKEKIELADLPDMAKEIAERIKYAEVYSTAASESLFEGSPARAVWCYFGYDKDDIINHLHWAYAIWAADAEMRQVYFKPSKNSKVIEDIYIYENTSYAMLKNLHKPTQNRDAFIESNRELLSVIVNLAERFIVDLQEEANKTVSIEAIKEKYREWIITVRKNYIRLTDGDIAPNDLHDWSEEIISLAGWVLDLSLIFENKKGNGKIGERERWLIQDAIRKYHESMEKIKRIEENIDW